MNQLLNRLLVAMAITLAATPILVQPGQAQSRNQYYCKLKGTPQTFVKTSTGKKFPIISWKSKVNPEWPPQKRCQEVSKRFQRYSDHGVLKHIGTGILNGKSVLCAVPKQGNACNAKNVLVTLPPDIDRYEAGTSTSRYR